MGTQGAGRKRSTKKERSTAEDDALNLIAREAEARLAAKRAARAEAREIRMKELERQQKEIFQVQKKYYGLDTKLDDRSDSKWGDIEQWMEDSERYSRSSRIHTVSDDDERMSVGSRGSVRSDLDAVGAYGGGDSSSHKKSKKKKKHKHKDKDRNGYDDDYSVISSRSSRLSDDSRVSRSSRLDLTSSRLSDDTRVSRASRLDLQPASYASSDLYSYNGLSSTRNPGSAFNGYQSALYEDSLCSGSQRVTGSSSHPLEYTSYRSSGSRASSRASSARASPVDNCGSVASFLRSAASSSGLRRDLDDVTIPDFSHVEDKDYLEKGSRAGSALTAATLTSLGGSSSRRGSGETALTVDAETSIREIKEIHELKDQIQDVETKYMQNLKEVKDALVEVEEKYRKAMVSNAQLDNEKNNLMYQVDTLKDSLMELEEQLSESRRGYEEKVKEYEREKHAHTVLQFQFSEMKETLKQSEDLLNDIRQLNIKQEGFVREISDLQETVEWKDKKIGALERQKEYSDAIRIERDELREEVVKLKDILKKHGIVLGPDLNLNGEIGEAEVDGSLSADQASPPAKDSQTSPTEGNSMLGNTEETQLRSSEEEAVDPEQHQEMFEEAKESHSSSDTLCNVDGVSTLETFREEQPTKEQQTCLEEDKKIASQEETMIASQVYNVKELALSKDLNDIYDESITEAKDLIICSHGLQGLVTSSEESVPEAETREGGDLGQTETKSSSVDTHSDDIREPCSSLFKEQGNKQEDVEESNLRNTESCLQQKVAQDVMKESFPDESVPAVSNTEPQLEPENADEAENDEADETSSKCQPQGAASAGKKKKRKRRGKKKGGTHEEKSQQKDGTDKEKGKPENEIEMTTRENKPTTDAEIDGSATETLKESSVDQVTNDQDRQETEGVDGVEAVEPTESVSRHEESRTDHVTDEHDKEQTLEMDNVEGAMTTTETFSHIETLKDVRADHVRDEQNRAQSLETQEVEAVEAVAPSSEISSDVETLKELRTDPRQDEENKKQTLETEKVEEVASLKSPVPETDLGTSDLIDISKSAESTDDLDKECVSSLDNSKSETGISTNDSVIHTEDSERVEKAEDEVGSVDERGSECTTNNPKNTFETSAKENTEAESQVPNNGDTSVSLPPTEGFTDLIKSLSTSEVSAVVGSDDTIMVLERKEATERVEDDEQPGAEIEQGSLSPSIVSPSHDRDDSELKADKAENEELNGGLGEAEGAVEPDSASITKHTDALGTVQSLLESAAQGEQLDDGESQTLQCEDQIEESKVEESSESEEIDISDPPKEATESESSIEQDHRTEESACAEDPEHKNSQQSEKQQVHEPGIDKSEDNDSSQHIVQESDEEDEVDDGQSFDFHDMDLEAAVAASIPENPKQEEVEEGVEVVSDESNNGISSKTESNEKRQDEPVEIIEEKSMGDRGNQVDTLDTLPRDNQNSFAHEDATSVKGQRLENVCEMQKNMPEEEVGVTDEPRHVIEEGKVLNVGELGVVAEDISRAMSLPVEEGLDAIKYELQGKHLESPKSAEEVARTKEPQDTGRDVKKSTKKGKGKGKEECKMS